MHVVVVILVLVDEGLISEAQLGLHLCLGAIDWTTSLSRDVDRNNPGDGKKHQEGRVDLVAGSVVPYYGLEMVVMTVVVRQKASGSQTLERGQR
jgi:hypothetical protein